MHDVDDVRLDVCATYNVQTLHNTTNPRINDQNKHYIKLIKSFMSLYHLVIMETLNQMSVFEISLREDKF